MGIVGVGLPMKCAAVKGEQGVRLRLQVTYLEGRRHLPMVTLNTAA